MALDDILKRLTAGLVITFIVLSKGFAIPIHHGVANDRVRIQVQPECGDISLYIDQQLIIDNAYAEAVVNGQKLASSEYTTHEVTKQTGSEGKIILQILHKREGLPDLLQRFTLLESETFVVAELEIIGTDLESNSISVIKGDHLFNSPIGETNFIRVPYDNDTFIRYEVNSVAEGFTGRSSEVSSLYQNGSRAGFVLGSLDQSVWKTGIIANWVKSGAVSFEVLNGFSDAALTRDSMAHGSIKSDTLKSAKVFLGWYSDWRDGMNDYSSELRKRTVRSIESSFESPYSWNSWGAIQTELNLDKAKAVVDFFADSIPYFRNEGAAYIGLDSYWDNMIEGGLEGDFSKLRAFAEYCRNRGLKPGIYWAPFVDWGKTDRRVEGSDYHYRDIWTKTGGRYHDIDGARALDPTHPGTKQRIALLINKFNEIGFDLIKIDFIGHASIEADSFFEKDIRTGMQAFHHGMQYLVDQINGKMLIYAAISPNIATFPYAHSRRIACDAYADINATEYTLNSTTFGWWLGSLYDFIDADHLVFGDEQSGTNRARLSSGIINGTLTLGDNYSRPSTASTKAKHLLNNPLLLSIAQDGEAFMPVEHDTSGKASEIFTKEHSNDFYIALVNYNGNEKKYVLSLARLGIPSGAYEVTEIYSGAALSMKGKDHLEVGVPGSDSKILRLRKNID